MTGCVLTVSRQFDFEFPADLRQKLMWSLEKNARAIAGVGFAAAGAAVVQVHQHLQRLLDNLVRLAAFDVDDETDTTGIVLILRIIKTLFGRQAGESRAALLLGKAVSHFSGRRSNHAVQTF